MDVLKPALPQVVLVLDSGSSSLKFGVYRVDAQACVCLIAGEAQGIDAREGAFQASDDSGQVLVNESGTQSTLEALQRIDSLLHGLSMQPIDAVGHRLVHGGPTLRQPCRIDDAVMETLTTVSALAPLHTPAAIALIDAARQRFPECPQVACFDTGFHAHLPAVARCLPLPQALRDEGLQRYGFHGLSCESILQQLGDEVPQRLIIAHLGSGASVTAVRQGRSVDTSMGLTPGGGVIMATRCGDLDPGVMLYLMRQKHLDADALEGLLDRESGLLGISGISADMRALHAAAPAQRQARLAIAMFCHSVFKQIAAMMAVLGGLDLLVFTGGIGEHDADIRARICAGLAWTGLALDPGHNHGAVNPLEQATSRCAIRLLPSQEARQIARHTYACLHRTLTNRHNDVQGLPLSKPSRDTGPPNFHVPNRPVGL